MQISVWDSLPHQSGQYKQWGNLSGAALALTLIQAAEAHSAPLVVICDSILQTEILYQACRFFAGELYLTLMHFPDRETLPYDSFSPHHDLTSSRLLCLYQLSQLKKGLVFAAGSTISHRLLPFSFLHQNSFFVSLGQKLAIDAFRQQLTHIGYHAVSQVIAHGEYAIRGSIIDVYPMGSSMPVRIDLFDDEIESLRLFNPDDQLTLEKITELAFLPAHEFPLEEKSITLFRQKWRDRFHGNPMECPVYQNISHATAIAGCEYYLPLFFETTSNFFDYIPKNALIIRMANIQPSLQQFWKDIEYRYEQYRYDLTRPLLSPHELFIPIDDLFHTMNQFPQIAVHENPIAEKTGCQNFSITHAPSLLINRKGNVPLEALQQYLATVHHKIIFSVESPGRREVLLELFAPIQVHPLSVPHWQAAMDSTSSQVFLVAPLQTGFIVQDEFEVITENQLFGENAYAYQSPDKKTSKYAQQADAQIRNLLELKIGDAIVHMQHGIGRYQGLQTLSIDRQPQEFLMITYADDAKLYVPVSSLHLISRYAGAETTQAPLHRLGTDKWNQARKKAAEKARDVAAELLSIYAKRETKKGFVYKTPATYSQFASNFPFEETPDQARAIQDIIADMTSLKMMDRLICGDVGFGKTEVAMRSAFVAVENNKQVVVLVPTTLLAQQHYQTFLDRFADWPIKIEVLSRFKSKHEADEILKKISEGTVDIVIGTHKLLQKDIQFAKLGLLVIDEEHRFGVKQKERLKRLRAEVDILTLTATPIPRTLNLSLSGIRDLSLITTPPARRLSVKTFVYERRKEIIREAMLRELQRGGQIYFLHNSVDTITKVAEDLKNIVPDLRLGIAHGQMREKQLEAVMLDFYHHRVNVLVCTTIIESGIDVPTANTIIIDRADKLGLAELHQLRGRVGRSHHQAYAYLLVPDFKSITSDAEKRLEAIASHEDLGAGFMLANQDLEIRGAGELLGEEQSGQIQTVGFTLYIELLERAVHSLKAGRLPSFDDVFTQATEIELKIPVLIPEDYLPDIHTRLILYKRIANCKDVSALKELQIELIDRFGLLPQPLKNLVAVTEIRFQAEKMGIQKLEASTKQGKIIFNPQPSIDAAKLIQLIQTKPKHYQLAGQDKLNFFFESEIKPERLTEAVREVLFKLSGQNI